MSGLDAGDYLQALMWLLGVFGGGFLVTFSVGRKVAGIEASVRAVHSDVAANGVASAARIEALRHDVNHTVELATTRLEGKLDRAGDRLGRAESRLRLLEERGERKVGGG